MRILATIVIASLLNGCVGLAVGTYGTFEQELNSVSISDTRNQFGYESETNQISKKTLVSTWGKPDEVSRDGKCEVLTYYDGYSWSGVGAILVFIPVPLLVPTGHDENRFYFINDLSVGHISEYGDVTGMLGYSCGSNECGASAGPVNTHKTRKAMVRWCE